jgi:hypothetical protein
LMLATIPLREIQAMPSDDVTDARIAKTLE